MKQFLILHYIHNNIRPVRTHQYSRGDHVVAGGESDTRFPSKSANISTSSRQACCSAIKQDNTASWWKVNLPCCRATGHHMVTGWMRWQTEWTSCTSLYSYASYVNLMELGMYHMKLAMQKKAGLDEILTRVGSTVWSQLASRKQH